MDGWRTECAWCGALMKGVDASPNVTHGICHECVLRQRREMEQEWRDYDQLRIDIGGEG